MLFHGDGPLGEIFAEASPTGEILSTGCAHPHIELEAKSTGKLDVGRGIGHGILAITMGTGENSYTSSTAIQSGEIAQDISHFLLTKKKVPSALKLGVLLRDRKVVSAAGLLVTMNPEFVQQNPKKVAAISQALREMGELTPALDQGIRLEELLSKFILGC